MTITARTRRYGAWQTKEAKLWSMRYYASLDERESLDRQAFRVCVLRSSNGSGFLTYYDFNQETEDADLLSSVLLTCGRNKGPYLLDEWLAEGLLNREVLRSCVLDVWTAAGFPATALNEHRWLEIFALSGYVCDTDDPPPTEPLTVYRGTEILTRGRGFSWTRTEERLSGSRNGGCSPTRAPDPLSTRRPSLRTPCSRSSTVVATRGR